MERRAPGARPEFTGAAAEMPVPVQHSVEDLLAEGAESTVCLAVPRVPASF